MRLPRQDGPGTLHHVMNRGIARRPVFETEADIRFFLSRIAWEVKHGRILLHAFAVLATHFHLLVESTMGELSKSMKLIENSYVRWFNRRRKRDGSLFRGRFTSRPIQSMAYLITVVRYIDSNPVSAGLAEEPEKYPYCSASHYSRWKSPRWLSRDKVEELVESRSSPGVPKECEYRSAFPLSSGTDFATIVDRRLRQPPGQDDPLRDLVGSAPGRVRDWMIRKAVLADGTKPGISVVSPQAILAASSNLGGEDRIWGPGETREAAVQARILVGGVLRLCGGLSLSEIANRLTCSQASAHNYCRAFRKLIEEDADFAGVAGDLLHAALEADHPWAALGNQPSGQD